MRLGPVVGVGLLLVCLAAPATASGPELYVLGGLALANLGGDSDQFGDAIAAALQSQAGGAWISNKKSRKGADLGIGAKFGKWQTAGGAVEARYATRGVKYDLREVSGSGVKASYTLKLNYVELPFLLELRPTVSGSVKPSLVLGPVVGFRASAKGTTASQGQSSTQDLPSDFMKDTTFGGLIGIGVSIKATPNSSVLLQARIQAGFTNLVDDPTLNLKPRDFSIMAGWSMPR